MSEQYATTDDVRVIRDGLHDMTTEIAKLVVEIRHSNERTDENIKSIQTEQKSLREDVTDLRVRMPLVEDTRKDIKAISTKIIGSILVVALMSALAVGFSMKNNTGKVPTQQNSERSK